MKTKAASNSEPTASLVVSVLIFVVAVALMAFLRLHLFGDRYVALTYGLPLLICLWHRSRLLLWSMAAAFIGMATYKALWLLPDPNPGDFAEGTQWVMQVTNILVIGGAVNAILNLTNRLHAKNVRLEEANAELEAREVEISRQNEELQTQSEELTQQNEELQHQSEELSQQNEELQQQAEELEQQSEELSVQAEELQAANQELNERESMLQTLLTSLRGARDERQMLQQVCQALIQLAGESVVAAAVVEKSGEQLAVRVQAGAERLKQEAWPFGNSFASLVMAQGRTAYVDDLAARPDLTVPEPEDHTFRSLLATPLRVHGQAIGALEIYSLEPRQWTKHQFQIIEWAATQCSLALETLRLEQELQQSEAAAQHHRQLLQTVVNHLPAAVNVIRGSDLRIQLVNPAYQAIAPGKEMPGKTLDELWPETQGNFGQLCRRVLETGQPHQAVDEPYRIARVPGAPLEEAFFSWSLFRVRLPGDDGWAILNTAWETTERKRAEEALRLTTRRYALLSETAGALLAASNPQVLVEELCRKVMAHLQCGVFFNFLADEASGRLRLNACGGVSPEQARTMEWLEYGTAVCGCVARDKERLIVKDVQHVEDKRTDLVKGFGVQAYCCHPLLAGERLLGTLSFGATNRGQFNEDEVELMRAVADLVAVAMERIRVEEALRANEEQLRLAALAANIGVWSWKPGTSDVVVSANWRSLFGVSPDAKVTFETWRNAIHPEDRERAVRELSEAGEQRREFNAEYRALRPDGSVRWIVDRGRAWHDAEGRPASMSGVNVDITEQKEAQQVLARSKEELEQLVAQRTAKLQELVSELEHFSYTITHDMRAPLRAMKGYGEVINELCAACPQQEPRMFMKRIMTAADRMDALIRDALNYSRAVRQELPLEPVDADALLRGMLESYPELQPSRAKIRIEGDLPVVMANEAGLTQCFSNLLGNAVKFVRPGKTPEIRVWAETGRNNGAADKGSLDSTQADRSAFGAAAATATGLSSVVAAGRPVDRFIRIWVEDNGIGIPQTMLPRIFDMFARGHNSHEGTGIGLALVRKVMDRMGGRVGAESQDGTGSRFWLELQSAD